MELRFDGKVAIVTGAGNGLGRAHALLLASRGAKVVVNDLGGAVDGTRGVDGTSRSDTPAQAVDGTSGSDTPAQAVDGTSGSDTPAQAVADEIRASGGEAIADGNSVATAEGGQALIDAAVEAWGRVDVVVNNAGILRNALFETMTEDRLEPVLDVHLRGAFNVTRPAWLRMRDQGGGRIVHTTSAVGMFGNGGMSNYGAAKGGVYGLTRVLAIEGAPHGIKVNAIAPTAATRMLTEAMGTQQGPADPAALEQIKAIVAALDPALVSPVVAFLAHEDCPVTGEIYTVGGGQVSRLFMARAPGYFSSELSIEDVRDHFTEIRAEDGYTVPGDSGAENQLILEAIAKQGHQFL